MYNFEVDLESLDHLSEPKASGYGVVYYPMIKAVLSSHISELRDCNSPLHICVIYTQMYVLEGMNLGASRPASRLFRGEATK